MVVRSRDLNIAESGVHQYHTTLRRNIRGDPDAIGACRQHDIIAVIILNSGARNVLVMILDVVQRVLGNVHRLVGLGVDLDYVTVIVRQGEDEMGIVVAMSGNCLHRNLIWEILRNGHPSATTHQQYG